MVLSLPAIASAQWRDRDDDDDYNRRNGTYNNGRYGNYGNTRDIVRNLKSRTRELVRQIDRDLDRSRYDGSNREDRINEVADRFRDAVNDLDNNERQNSREIQRVQQQGHRLDQAIRRSRLSYNAQNLWNAIRSDLQALGGNGYYDNNNRNNRNRYPNGNNYPNTNNRNRNGLPSWWPF